MEANDVEQTDAAVADCHEDCTNGSSNEANEDIVMGESAIPRNGCQTDVQLTEPNCLMQLVFKDNDTFDDLHQTIGQCIRNQLFSLKRCIKLCVDKEKMCVNIFEISNDCEDSVFMVDTLPTEETNDDEIPDYNSSAVGMLEEETVAPEEPEEGVKPKGNCWNCGGDHTMRDCKEKRDPVAINRAKQAFNQKPRTERYHMDSEQKYSHLVPGKISDDLRRALGLRSRELPLYIYKMRLFGYPDGWLEEAKVNHSGLSLFMSDDKNADDDGEDGVDTKVTFDASKFIEYPGFNARVPSNLIDEADYYKVPSMNFEHSKEGLTQLLQNSLTKKYKRKPMQLTNLDELRNENVKDDDMDLQDSDEDTSSPASALPQSAHGDSSNGGSNTVPDMEASCDSNHLSLLELKRKQEEILRALEDASSDSNSNVDEKPETKPITDQLQSNSEEQIANESILETTIEMHTEVSVEMVQSIPSTPSGPVTGRSVGSVGGTPLIKQVSPFTKLPVGNKWSVGVTDVIDFENLPDATGTYKKMTDVISKVRKVIKQINNDPDNDSS